MTKEFIPYDLYLDLKKLGFEEECLSYPVSTKDASGRSWTSVLNAPLYQQAFRWFRDNHELEGFVEGKGYNHKKYYIYTINGKWHPSQPAFDTHEEAELECLKKLIEIVKNK
jgi:hypothetical protein